MSMEVLSYGRDWLAINKPSGISVHNDKDHDVISAIKKQYGEMFQPVHRLDKGTSGVLLIARGKTLSVLQKDWREVSKPYWAIVRGQPKSVQGTWQFSLRDRAEGRKNPRGVARYRVSASTHYTCLSYNQHISLLNVILDTGRQHQIRRHCVLAGHEILGDTRYGDPRYQKKIAMWYKGMGLLLHAHTLIFSIQDQRIEVHAPRPRSWDSINL